MKNRIYLIIITTGVLIGLLQSNLFAQFKIERSSITNGATVSNSSSNKIRSSVGESIIGTSSNGSYETYFGFLYTQQPMITDVKSRNSLIPDKFEMSQNYPNPFNPSTAIEFAVPQESRVVLEVFNILGEKMTTLVNETKAPGNYSVNFDGSLLSSGFYIYRIQTDNPSSRSGQSFTEVKKMILLK